MFLLDAEGNVKALFLALAGFLGMGDARRKR